MYTNHQKYRSICSNVILGETVFDNFDYFKHAMIIGTPVKEWHNNVNNFKRIQSVFVSVIFTVDVLGIGGRQPAQARVRVKCLVI